MSDKQKCAQKGLPPKIFGVPPILSLCFIVLCLAMASLCLAEPMTKAGLILTLLTLLPALIAAKAIGDRHPDIDARLFAFTTRNSHRKSLNDRRRRSE